MKTYTIINTDIMHKGKVFSEGSTIELDEKDAVILSAYLTEAKVSLQIADHSSLITNNSLQKNKRKK